MNKSVISNNRFAALFIPRSQQPRMPRHPFSEELLQACRVPFPKYYKSMIISTSGLSVIHYKGQSDILQREFICHKNEQDTTSQQIYQPWQATRQANPSSWSPLVLIILNIMGCNVTKQNKSANGCAKCSRYVWVRIN